MLRRENIFRVCLKSHWRSVIVWCRIAEKFFAGKFVQVYKIIAFDFDGTPVDSVDFCLPVSFHGTGDVFASGCFAALMSGQALPDALKTAVEFTLDAIRQTISEPDHIWYGVNFEKSIPKLLELL